MSVTQSVILNFVDATSTSCAIVVPFPVKEIILRQVLLTNDSEDGYEPDSTMVSLKSDLIGMNQTLCNILLLSEFDLITPIKSRFAPISQYVNANYNFYLTIGETGQTLTSLSGLGLGIMLLFEFIAA